MAKGRQREKSEPPQAPAKQLSPQMQQAWKLFDAGDKVAARREAQALLSTHPAEADAEQARELLERLRMPRIALILGGVAAVVIVALIALAVLRY